MPQIPAADKPDVVKVPLCIDFMGETSKEKEIPGYVAKTVAWADIDLETAAYVFCGDDDPIYQNKFINERWS